MRRNCRAAGLCAQRSRHAAQPRHVQRAWLRADRVDAARYRTRRTDRGRARGRLPDAPRGEGNRGGRVAAHLLPAPEGVRGPALARGRPRKSGVAGNDAGRRIQWERSCRMPLARIDLVRGKPADYRRAVGEVVYDAMVAALNAPKDDRFQVVTEHSEDGLIADPNYLGIRRTKDCIFIQLTLNEGRSEER